MKRLIRLGAVIVVIAVAAGAGWWVATSGVVAGAGDGTGAGATDGEEAVAEPATATVERQTLTVTESLDGTLGYAGEYEIAGGLSGTLTWTVPAGTVVIAGDPLYEVDGSHRASLLYGRRPAWRALEPDMSAGTDVRQLEENLLLLGYTRDGDEIDRHWDDDTTAAVKRWQRDRGQTADGEIELGEVVFLPEPIRVTEIKASPGSRVGGGALLAATSNRRVVTVDLDANDRELLDVGAAVSVELPDGTTIDGSVVEIGRVAESSSDGQGGTSTTLPVTITLADAEAGSDLDAAPVEVSVVTETRENVLTVPVNALVALIEGGYAVEVVDDAAAAADPASSAAPSPDASAESPTSHLIRVEPGLFDSGLVEVTSDDLEAGDSVVVPS